MSKAIFALLKIKIFYKSLYLLIKLATPGGFEPPASRLGILRSIQLSYGIVWALLSRANRLANTHLAQSPL